ncbi:MAG: aminotransferase class IV [Cyanobacteria bacterium J06641_5]
MYWYGGELIDATQLTLSVDEPGLLFGATVFTTLRSRGGQPVVWEAHRDRLNDSVRDLGWQLPDWERVESGLQEIAKLYPVVRVTLFPDGREWILGRSLPADLAIWQRDGARVIVLPNVARSLPAHKTGNYLACWQVRAQARQQHAQEAIFTDASGAWLETSTGNLWGLHRGTWLTPPLAAGILPGIARSRLWETLIATGNIPATPFWDAELVAQLDAIAYSNCIVGVVPLREVRWPTGEKRVLSVDCQALRHLQQQLPECLADADL